MLKFQNQARSAGLCDITDTLGQDKMDSVQKDIVSWGQLFFKWKGICNGVFSLNQTVSNPYYRMVQQNYALQSARVEN